LAEVVDVLEDVADFFVLSAVFGACFVLEPSESGTLVDGSSYLFPSSGVAAKSAQSSPASKRAGIVANMEEREERMISLYARFAHEEQPEPVTLRSELCRSAVCALFRTSILANEPLSFTLGQ
jgi:hypothetical protein